MIPFLYPYQIPFIAATLGIISVTINAVLHKITLYWQKEMAYFLAFFIFITLGVPISYNFMVSYDYWSQVFLKIGVIFFMVIWTITSKESYKSIISITITCGVFIALNTIYNKYYPVNLTESSRVSVGGNALSLIGDPNDLALTLLFPFSFCCSLFITKTCTKFQKLVGLFSSLIIIEAIIATQSRGGLLGLCGVIGYFFTRRFKSKTLLVVFIVTCAYILYVLSHIATRDVGSSSILNDESSMGRIHAWEGAVNMAIHHPIWGVGLNGFRESLFTYAIVWENYNRAVHSSWFGVLAEGGFIGLALFIACAYQAMKLAHRNIILMESLNPAHLKAELILAQSLFAGLIGFCISSTFLTQGFSWPFYIFFALSISLTHTNLKMLKTTDEKANET